MSTSQPVTLCNSVWGMQTSFPATETSGDTESQYHVPSSVTQKALLLPPPKRKWPHPLILLFHPVDPWAFSAFSSSQWLPRLPDA